MTARTKFEFIASSNTGPGHEHKRYSQLKRNLMIFAILSCIFACTIVYFTSFMRRKALEFMDLSTILLLGYMEALVVY
jgi:hypothetical protein